MRIHISGELRIVQVLGTLHIATLDKVVISRLVEQGFTSNSTHFQVISDTINCITDYYHVQAEVV